MTNFVSICSQLKQGKIPVYCDEKVYCIVKEIQFIRPDEFQCIIPMLGTFHTVKMLLKCIGKSLQGSGAESILLNAGGYGPTIIDGSILNGKHYNRALEGLSALAESMHRLIYKEFFLFNGVDKYKSELETLVNFKKSVETMDTKKSLEQFKEFCSNENQMCNDLKQFIDSRASLNENFKYWVSFLEKMQIVFDLLGEL